MAYIKNCQFKSLSLCDAGIPDKMVKDGVDAILSRMAKAYLELMREANRRPEIVSDYKSSLRKCFGNRYLTSDMWADLREAQEMAPDCKVITKNLPSEKRISIFSDTGFDENQPLDKARVYIRLRINAKDIKEEDALDRLLSQLSKKILSLGYGGEGTFDIRFEKGFLSSLEGRSWKWHYDGATAFETSIAVCFSNKEKWSTRVNGRPAEHGFFYDALKVYHRAPIPSDLEGEELNADDYRLFIRYNEFSRSEKAVVDSDPVKSVTTFSETPIERNLAPKLESLLGKEQSFRTTIFSSNLLDSRLLKDTFVKLTLPPPRLQTALKVDFSELFSKSEVYNQLVKSSLEADDKERQ